MKRKIAVIFGVVVCSMLGVLFSKTDAFAGCDAYSVNTPANGIPKAYNTFRDTDPYYFACVKNSSGAGPLGVMVLSQIVTGGVPSGGGTMHINTYMDYNGSATQNFYVTGGHYTRSNTSRYHIYGIHVKVRTAADGDDDWSDQGIITGNNFDYSDSWGDYVDRGYKNGNKDYWKFGPDYTISISRDRYYDESIPGLVDAGSGLVYRVVGLYRCYHDSTGYSGSCAWADMKLYGKKKPSLTTYSGTSSVTDGGASVNNQSKTINSPSHTYKFTHKVKREDNGSDEADNECYKVDTNVSGKGRSDSCSDYNKNQEITVHDVSVDVSLQPGASTTIYQDLRFQPSNRDDSYSGAPSQSCTLSGYASGGRVCVKVSRPSAKFTGSVTPTVTSTDGGTNYTISGGRARVDSSDGKFKIKFINRVNRNNDSAGGTVGSPWDTRATKAGVQQNADNGTVNLTEGSGSNVKTYEYTGTLRYGEEITYCSYLNYTHTIVGTAKKPASSCVTVYRENAKCSFAESFTYGLNKAVNTGRIGVRNSNLSSAISYTTPNSAMTVSVYARPTDQIKFYYDMCAGVVYPIKERGLSTEVTYTATGSSSKSSGNGNKYLFGEQVTSVNSYTNPKTWSSKATSGFMSNVNNIEAKNIQSPSSGAGTNYRCGTTVSSGWYQVSGKANEVGNEACARSGNYNIGVIDVGSTITQKLSWNDQTFDNGTFGSASRTATANVVVPYNYVLKPYITNSAAANRMAYLGETVHMVPGVVVAKRKNSDVSNQTYATITKKTNIRVEYYYTDSTGVTIKKNPTAIYSKNNLRLNSESNLNGTGDSSDAYLENGGSVINPGDAVAEAANFNVPVNDSTLVPGDRVCMRIRVWPVDSHDNPNAATVAATAVSLSESGAGEGSARTTTSCLTVAKRPTMSVEGSNAYSATTIKTSQFNKNLGDTKFRFGSWSEYGVFARVDTGSFAFGSGAVFGYNREGYTNNAGWIKQLNVTRNNPSGSTNVATEGDSSTCTYMTQTFANANCQSGAKNIGGVAADQFSDRMISRYGQSSPNIVNVPTATMDGKTYQNLSAYSDGGVVDDSGAVVIRPSGDAYLGGNWAPNIPAGVFAEKEIISRNRTVVYSLPNNTLVINGNINKQDGAISNNGQINGVVIIANKVLIASDVTYINATIVANEVNTCAFASDGSAVSFADLKWTGSGSRPCAKSLQFDSPVSTKRIILNRTAGANNGTQSIVRAEVFNLNAAQLLWSYNQMARYNQAITTYSREISPRY